jgi:outer membrane cobalamin receptor
MFLSTSVFAGSIAGKVSAKESGDALVGANVFIAGTTIGTATDDDGMFYLKVQNGTYTLVCDYVGYAQQEVVVEVVGDYQVDFNLVENLFAKTILVVANQAIDRLTPVAFTNVNAEKMEAQLASRDVPMILNTTPGVYATEQGGGYGDARMNVRGFDQANTAIMINGVPVNDMENGWVYWSNWAGIGDVTSSVQVQRGLGASLFSTPSVGGTINVVTKSLDLEPMVRVKQEFGSYDFQKTSAVYSSGLQNNFAFTALVSRTTATGFAEQTYLNAFSYFFDLGYILNSHTFEFTLIGAPQTHGQRSTSEKINTFQTRGINFNQNWGYLNGEPINLSENFYHKPVANLNWNWKIDNKMSLSSIIYASLGTGGGTGGLGSYFAYTPDGHYDYDAAYAFNSTNIDNIYSTTLKRSTRAIRASRNNHFWTGLISTFKYDMNENLNFNLGFDGRYYEGEHYRTIENLMGGDYYIDTYNKNRDPKALLRVGDKVAYSNDGLVQYLGVFGQTEYKLGGLATFVNLSLNNTGYNRIDYFNFLDSDPEQETGYKNFLGYTAKLGGNYNINRNLNLFVNAGYISKAPLFRNVYDNYNNEYKDVENEGILAFEGGIGYSTEWFAIDLNGYNTSWTNKSILTSVKDDSTGEYFYYNVAGLGALHQGIELDSRVHINQNLDLNLALSHSLNKWTNDVSSVVYPESDPNQTKEVNTYAKDVIVGNMPMTQFALGLNYRVAPNSKSNFFFNPMLIFFGRQYAGFSPDQRIKDDTQPWKMPDYSLINIHAGYKFKFENSAVKSLSMNFNLFNAFDVEYITDASDASSHESYDAKVYYGKPRNANLGLTLDF